MLLSQNSNIHFLSLDMRRCPDLAAIQSRLETIMYSEKLCHMYLTVQMLTSYYHNTAGNWKVLPALCWCCSYLRRLLSERAGGQKALFKPFPGIRVGVFSASLATQTSIFGKRIHGYMNFVLPLNKWQMYLSILCYQFISSHLSLSRGGAACKVNVK